MRAAGVIMLIVALLIAASQQTSPMASMNWNARTSSRGLRLCLHQAVCGPERQCARNKCIFRPCNETGGGCYQGRACNMTTGKCYPTLKVGDKCENESECLTKRCYPSGFLGPKRCQS